jgi:hypothetical protein
VVLGNLDLQEIDQKQLTKRLKINTIDILNTQKLLKGMDNNKNKSLGMRAEPAVAIHPPHDTLGMREEPAVITLDMAQENVLPCLTHGVVEPLDVDEPQNKKAKIAESEEQAICRSALYNMVRSTLREPNFAKQFEATLDGITDEQFLLMLPVLKSIGKQLTRIDPEKDIEPQFMVLVANAGRELDALSAALFSTPQELVMETVD